MESPFGQMVINREKTFDFRKTKTPANKQGVPLLLITDGKVLGEIIITKCGYSQTKHTYYWQLTVLKKYQEIKKVKKQSSQNGEWVSDVIVGM